MSWLKIKAAAGYSGVSPRTLRTWLRKGLPHSRVTPMGAILISEKSIDEVLQSCEVEENQVEDIVKSVVGEVTQ